MFSPYYAARGRRAPEDHVCLNVALYGRPSRWAMTERGRAALSRSASELAIGPSRLIWDGTGATFDIAETDIPRCTPIRGRVRVIPETLSPHGYALDAAGRHLWRPFAPVSRIEVEMERPALRWRGAGYFDSNWGTAPLEDDFRRWSWSRAALGSGAGVLYDATEAGGARRARALRFDRKGGAEEAELPPVHALPRTRWRLPREVRADPGAAPRLVAVREDAPFYARSEVETMLFGERARAMTEDLDGPRLRNPLTRFMVRWRMPRTV